MRQKDKGAEDHEKVTGEQWGESEWITWKLGKGSKRAIGVVEMLQYLNIC